jgi:transposase-like protein
MPVGGPASYFFRGASPEAEAQNPMEALRALWQDWASSGALVGKNPGNIVFHMTVGNQVVVVEITDSAALSQFATQGPGAVVDLLVKSMGLPEKEAFSILEEAYTQVRVDVLQDPKDPNAWQPGKTLSPRGDVVGGDPIDQEMPKATGRFIGQLLKDEDKVSGRGPQRRRTPRGRELVKIALTWGKDQKKTIPQISKATGIPKTTLSDARRATGPKPKPPKIFQARKTGERLTPAQKAVVAQELKKNKNAAAVARKLGIPARTVRDARKAMATKTTKASLGTPKGKATVYTAKEKQRLFRRVKNQKETPTEAARKLGVPERTARGWVAKARREGTL